MVGKGHERQSTIGFGSLRSPHVFSVEGDVERGNETLGAV